MATMTVAGAWTGQVQAWHLDLHLDLPHGWQGPTLRAVTSCFPWVREQGVGSETE